ASECNSARRDIFPRLKRRHDCLCNLIEGNIVTPGRIQIVSDPPIYDLRCAGVGQIPSDGHSVCTAEGAANVRFTFARGEKKDCPNDCEQNEAREIIFFHDFSYFVFAMRLRSSSIVIWDDFSEIG